MGVQRAPRDLPQDGRNGSHLSASKRTVAIIEELLLNASSGGINNRERLAFTLSSVTLSVCLACMSSLRLLITGSLARSGGGGERADPRWACLINHPKAEAPHSFIDLREYVRMCEDLRESVKIYELVCQSVAVV